MPEFPIPQTTTQSTPKKGNWVWYKKGNAFVNAIVSSIISENGVTYFEFEGGDRVEANKCFLTKEELKKT